MRLTLTHKGSVRSSRWHLTFPFVVLLTGWLAGCNNTCFSFTSNPPNSTTVVKVGDPNATCPLTTTNGAVRVQLQVNEPICSSCAGVGEVQQIQLRIRGIEVQPSPIGEDNSADWQQLLPAFIGEQPLQVHLVRGSDGWGTGRPLGEPMTIPAGVYRHIRVRLVPNPPASASLLSEKKECGDLLFNCVVSADGRAQPLLFDLGSSELRIPPERIEGGSLFILPGTDSDLVIELKPTWAWVSTAGEGVSLLPTLAGTARISRPGSQ